MDSEGEGSQVDRELWKRDEGFMSSEPLWTLPSVIPHVQLAHEAYYFYCHRAFSIQFLVLIPIPPFLNLTHKLGSSSDLHYELVKCG